MTEEKQSIIEFPCEFPIKAMGKHEDDIKALVVSIVEKHVECLTEDCLRTSPSKNGNYISITVTVTATSQEHLDNIYRALTAHEKILYVI